MPEKFELGSDPMHMLVRPHKGGAPSEAPRFLDQSARIKPNPGVRETSSSCDWRTMASNSQAIECRLWVIRAVLTVVPATSGPPRSADIDLPCPDALPSPYSAFLCWRPLDTGRQKYRANGHF